jgi:hypothetical protein
LDSSGASCFFLLAAAYLALPEIVVEGDENLENMWKGLGIISITASNVP